MRAILTRYFPATNYRAAWIQAKSDKAKVSMKINDDLTWDEMHRAVAEELCKKMNWNDVDLIQGSLGSDEVFVMVHKTKL